MKRSLRAFATVMLILVFFSGATAGLTEHEQAKLHPEFRALLSETHPELGFAWGSTARLMKSGTVGGAISYDAIIYVTDPMLVQMAGVDVHSSFPGFVTARVTPEQLLTLAHIDAVSYIDPGVKNHPTLDVSMPETGADLLHAGFVNGTNYRGNGAIVLIYDTGIDWKHQDFRSPTDTTKTRILAIWDQTLTPINGETSPSGLYGVEYTQAHINAELGGSASGLVREQDFFGHGTNVAGIAAGNGRATNGKYAGMAPEADIIVVKGGEGSFSESGIVDGLTYASAKASALGKPVIVNWSFGSDLGPHDGTLPYEMAVSSFIASPGRAVVVAAGNGGGTAIHVRGSTASPGSTSVQFNVAGYTPNGGAGNDQLFVEVWLKGNPVVTATLTSPHGSTAVTGNGQTPGAINTADGTILLWNTASYTNNGDHVIQIGLTDDGGNAPAQGAWTLTLAVTGSSVVYDGWLTSSLGSGGNAAFSGGDANRTVSSPGTGDASITVGAYVTKWSWPSYVGLQYTYIGPSDRTSNIASFSSLGPTRDGRQKPDLTAPGQGIASALSSVSDTSFSYPLIPPDLKHIVEAGTSFSAPHVTGAAALIFAAYPAAAVGEVKSLLTSTANGDAFTSTVPNATWGYGKLDVAEAMARKVSSTAGITRTYLSYDQAGNNVLVVLTGSTRLAQRISPAVSGRLEALQVNVSTLNNRPIVGNGPLVCEVYSDNAGLPGSKLGTSVNFLYNRLSEGTLNYVSMLNAGVTVTAGTTYHLVLQGTNTTDTLLVRADQVGGGRSSVFNGSAWGPLAANTIRVRAILATEGIVTSGPPGIPGAFALGQNYPNPFNPGTTMSYTLPEASTVTLTVFDLLGREIRTLVKGNSSLVSQGVYLASWDGKNDDKLQVASGVYFYRLEATGISGTSTTLVRKMILLR